MATAALPVSEPTRSRTLLVGTGLACAGVFMYFVGALAIYVAERQQTRAAGQEWIAHLTIELTPGVFMFFTTWLSIVTMAWAVWAIRRDDRKHTYMALGLTALFGLANINQTVFYLKDMDLPINTNGASVLLFTIVGSHMALILASVIFLAIVLVRTIAGQYNSRNADGIVAASMVWYVMSLVYMAIWFIIYVTK